MKIEPPRRQERQELSFLLERENKIIAQICNVQKYTPRFWEKPVQLARVVAIAIGFREIKSDRTVLTYGLTLAVDSGERNRAIAFLFESARFVA